MNIKKRISILGVVITLAVLLAGEDQGHPSLKTYPEKIAIDNKLSFIYDHDPSSSTTVIHLLFLGGKRAEQEAKKGLAYLTTGLCVSIPDAAAARKLMHLGSRFSFQSRADYSLVTGTCLSENLPETLRILVGIIKKPLFSGLRINNIKENMAARQKAEEDNPEQLLSLTAMNSFFNKTGYAGSAYGDKGSLKKIKKRDIVNFYRRFFNADNMVISVATDLDKAQITGTMKRFFLDFPRGEPYPFEPMTFSLPGKKEFFFRKDQEQALISFAALLPRASADHFILAFLLENLLGKGIGSRLWHLRSENELAYEVAARAAQLRDAGILEIYIKTDNRKRDQAYRALGKVIGDLCSKGIMEEEFNAARVHARADFLRMYESKEKRAWLHGCSAALNLGFASIQDFLSRMDSMTLNDMNTYIQKVLKPGNLIEVTIGREQTLRSIQ